MAEKKVKAASTKAPKATKKTATPKKTTAKAAAKPAKSAVKDKTTAKVKTVAVRKKTTTKMAAEAKATTKVKTPVVRKKSAPRAAKIATTATLQDDLSRGEKAVKIVIKYPKTAACVLGLILAAALPPYYQIWALFLAFSGLMFLAFGTSRTRKLVGLGYWFGFGYFAAGFYWIGNALLVDVVQTGWLYPLVLLLNGAFFGLFTILPVVVTKYGRNMVAKILLFAATWC